MTAPTTRKVTADLFQVIGTALAGARVVYTLNHAMTFSANGGGVVPAGSTTVVSDANGLCDANLVPNAIGDYSSQYGVEIYDAAGNKVFPAKGVARMYLQDQDALLHAILYSVPPMSQSDADRAVTESRNWATYITGDVPSTPGARSAQSWAQGDLRGVTYGGSAKDWASGTGVIDGVFFSARKYAVDTAADRANTGADRVQTGADRIQTGQDRVAADASAGLANVSMLTSIAQAGAALFYSLAAASVVSQDISGVTAAALHRSPNAVVTHAFYNAANDSNPNWPAQVDASYLYETLNGAWLYSGAANGIASEIEARTVGATLGADVVVNGGFASAANWTMDASFSIVNGKAVSTSTGSKTIYNTGQVVAGVTYVATWTQTGSVGVNATHINIRNPGDNIQAGPYINGNGPMRAVFTASVSGSVGLFNFDGGVSYDDFSVKPVTTINTVSGSYYQNATDGKFYRLWKNLLKAAEDLTQAAWTKANVSLVAGVADPNGGTSAFRITATAATGNVYQSFTAPTTGLQATSTVWLRRVSGTGIVRIYGPDGTTNTDITATLAGGAWQRITAPVTAAFSNGSYFGGEVVITTSGDVIEYAFPQLEIGTAATAYESKAIADGSQSETFRGNTARFPRQAAIVTEASRVVIYDLLSPGRPMWMVFSTATSALLQNQSGTTSVAMAGGRLVAGGNGVAIVDFAKDSGVLYTQGTIYAGKHTIAQRNSTLGFIITGNVVNIPSNVVSAVAMTTMPDAPVDPVTGLQVPTIAVGTGSNPCLIKHDGSVLSATGVGNSDSINITPYAVFGTFGPAGVNTWFALNPSALQANWTVTQFGGGTAPDFSQGTVAKVVMPRRGLVGRASNSASVPNFALLRHNEMTPGSSLAARIAPTYNTGLMLDPRRCLFSDVSVGVVSDVELVTNGGFDVDANWTKSPSVTWAGGQYTVPDVGGTDNFISQQLVGMVAGRTYRIVIDIVSNTTTSGTAGFRAAFGIAAGNSAPVPTRFFDTLVGVQSFDLIAPSSAPWITLHTSQQDKVVVINSVSVREVIADRTYKASAAVTDAAKSPAILGTLTKTQVASAAQLVFWGGWSAANYAQEAYNADYDVGTGGFALLPWITVPAKPVGTGVELVTNGTFDVDTTGWSKDAGNTTFSATVASGQLVIDTSATGVNAFFAYPVTTVIGTTYVLAGTVIGGTSGTRIVRKADNSGATVNVVDCQLGTGSNSVVFTATATTTYVICQVNYIGAGSTGIFDNVSIKQITAPVIVDRSAATGPYWRLGTDVNGKLVGEVSDNVAAPRIVTSPVSYAGAGAILPELTLSTSGALTLKVNGEQVAQTTGAPLATLNNAAAVTTWGNRRTLDAPFPGGIALARFGATVPTDDQSRVIYQQEKAMFRDGAQVTLPDSGALVDLGYGRSRDVWGVVSAAYYSEFSGLVRISATPVPAGSYSKVALESGMVLTVRTGNNPGVDVTMPSLNLKEESAKAGAEQAALRARGEEMFDYAGGFTATTTTSSAVLSAVANLSLPAQGGVSLQGASVSGVGIPANTTIAYHSGTTIHLSAPVTAGAAGTQINLLDFPLPTGMEVRSVFAGTSGAALKQEGTSKDYTRQFDGIREKPHFGAAPGNTAFVRVNARRMGT